MRVDGSRLGLIAYLWRIAAADDSNLAPTISISGLSLPPVFSATEDKTVSWSLVNNTNGAHITRVDLYKNSTDQLLANGASSQAAAQSTSSSTAGTTAGTTSASTTGSTESSRPTPPAAAGEKRSQTVQGAQSDLAQRDDNTAPAPSGAPALLTWEDNGGNGNVTMKLGTLESAWKDIAAVDQPLYLRLAWNDSEASGFLYSCVVAFYDTDAMKDELITNITDNHNPSYTNTPARPPEICASDGTACTTSVSTAPASTESTGTGALPPATTSSATAKSSHSKLSSGAIAGIAVGCAVAGLLVLAAVVFFLFRRRRNQRDRSVDIGLGSKYPSEGHRAIMADKEMHHIITDSPQSAFAQDEGVLHDHNTTAAGEAGHDEYQPYTDRLGSGVPDGSVEALGGGGADRPEARSTTPPPAPGHSRYAHLVEEGMTEDEIRRLEDEERQLDEAIQQDEARHHHTT